MIRALFTERYSRTDHTVFSEIPFNKSLHYIGTSQSIYIANELTGFCKAQVSNEKHFRTYTRICSCCTVVQQSLAHIFSSDNNNNSNNNNKNNNNNNDSNNNNYNNNNNNNNTLF